MWIKRNKYLEQLIKYKDKDLIKVITGARRCGKSVLLFELFYKYLMDNGVLDKNVIKINLENLDNVPLRDKLMLYKYIKSKILDNPKNYYVFIDEIQYVENFEDLLNTLKNLGCDVYVTGSNSKLLSSEISTALRGRSIQINVFPLSFSEYYGYVKGNERQVFNDYLLYGGFPYAATETDVDSKVEYLNMLQKTIATKDVIDHYKIRNLGAFYATYDFLCSNIGSYVSANKIANTLKSNGHKSITPDTIGNYINWLCESYLFYKVNRFDIKGRKYLKTQYKLYAIDLGLRNVQLNFRQVEPTHAIENLVYLELLSRGFREDIGKNYNKKIDFIVKNSNEKYYIQVAYTIAEPDKLSTELDSFRGLDDGYKKIIITNDEDPYSNLGNGFKKINTIDFLLNNNALQEI